MISAPTRSIYVSRPPCTRARSEEVSSVTDARFWHPWLRINRVRRVMLQTRLLQGGGLRVMGMASPCPTPGGPTEA
jgi:hypothetical protein